jgi:hypothetical protein
VDTASGSSCIFPFNYAGVSVFISLNNFHKSILKITYTTCTINGPNNGNYRPQCAISVNSNNTAITWSFCTGKCLDVYYRENMF